MNKEIYLQFILPSDFNFVPSDLMYKRAKEKPNTFHFSRSLDGSARLSYQNKLYKYDSYEIRKEYPLDINKHTVILKLTEI